MELVNCLIIYLVVVILIAFFLVRLGIKAGSSICISAFMGQILINVICPASSIDEMDDQGSALACYYALQLCTPIFVLFHSLKLAWYDRIDPKGAKS